MSGGRLTATSNDYTIAYARARRDLGCHYMIGFYDRHPEEDRSHKLRIESAMPGLTIRHAESYSFPSRESRRRMAVQAAYMVPTQFEGGGMRAEVFPIEPRDRRTWDTLVAIDFPLPLPSRPEGALRREFGAVLTNGPVVSKTFGRTVTLQAAASAKPGTRRLTFLEPASLSPGRYTLTAVLSDPDGESPFTSRVELTVPEIPSRRPFLVGPMIGRRRGSDVVIRGGEGADGAPADRVGGAASFRPLIVTEVDRSRPLFAFTEACVSKKGAKKGRWRVTRGLATAGGDTAGALEDASFAGRDGGEMTCERYLDQVPVSRLRLGAYTFSAAVLASDPDAKSSIDERSAAFLLMPEASVGALPAPVTQPNP